MNSTKFGTNFLPLFTIWVRIQDPILFRFTIWEEMLDV